MCVTHLQKTKLPTIQSSDLNFVLPDQRGNHVISDCQPESFQGIHWTKFERGKRRPMDVKKWDGIHYNVHVTVMRDICYMKCMTFMSQSCVHGTDNYIRNRTCTRIGGLTLHEVLRCARRSITVAEKTCTSHVLIVGLVHV